MRRAISVAAAALMLAATTRSHAWETGYLESDLWQSIYLTDPLAHLLPTAGFSENEHSELAHIALGQLGNAGCTGLSGNGTGTCTLTIVDLNASVYRPSLRDLTTRGDDPSTELEERELPATAHFSGIPDYSYSVYDWVNKNALCPPLPTGVPTVGCHSFLGWMGLFNANHFGTQSKHMYLHYHELALGLADRARALRELLLASPRALDRTIHADYVREAELEALAFEAVAQHYLQDRWSMGHMWERWGGADYGSISDPVESAMVGLAAGLLHGSESVTGLADPMCSPTVESGLFGTGATAVPSRFVLGGAELPGMGDHRVKDSFDGFFGVEFGNSDLPVDVKAQRDAMLSCSRAGWAEVIQGFGATQGGFGELGLAAPAQGDVRASSCWEAWATNGSIKTGWVSDPLVTTANTLSRITGVASGGGQGLIDSISAALGLRTSWVELTWRIRTRTLLDGEGATTLSRGAIGQIATTQPGNAYAFGPGGAPRVPDYTEPASLDSLPWIDTTERGRDRRTLYAFFNRAHTDHWCEDMAATLAELRGTDDAVKDEACTYLAERVYLRTDPEYQGKQTEERTVGDQPFSPICERYGVTSSGVDPDLPYYLDPGYVGLPGQWDVYGPASVSAWCRRLPVLDRSFAGTTSTPCWKPQAEADWDVVALVPPGETQATLTGRDLGAAGEIVVGQGIATESLPVLSWSAAAITVDTSSLSPGDWELQVQPAGDPTRFSVGRFVLRKDAAPPPAPAVTKLEFLGPLVPGEDVDFEVSVVDAETAGDLTQGDESIDVVCEALEGAGPFPGPGAADGPCGATFTATDTVKKPINDRSNCDPPYWEAKVTATDSALWPDATLGVATKSAVFDGQAFVENVAPVVAESYDPQEQIVPPGGALTLSVAVSDDNNDHPTECEELPASEVRLAAAPQGLSTTPPLDDKAVWVKDATADGVSDFHLTVTVEAPHEDHEAPAPPCQGPDPGAVPVDWTAADDAGLTITASPAPIPVRVANVPPAVTAVVASPSAIHPNVPTDVTFTVTVDDLNFPEDVEQVRLDLTGCGGEAELQLAPKGPPTGGVWEGVGAVVSADSAGCPVVATARDDDCAESPAFPYLLTVQNVPPVWAGYIAGQDGQATECKPITHVVGFKDENLDDLVVVAIIEGNGVYQEMPMAKLPSGNYSGTFEAPCAGDYTVTYRATETGLPPGATPQVAEAPPWTLTVLVAPEDCPKCHTIACEPLVATFAQPVTTYQATCQGTDLTYTWWQASCGSQAIEPGDPSTLHWSHPHPPCDPTTDHKDELASVTVSNGTVSVTCTYQGAATGVGPPCGEPVPAGE